MAALGEVNSMANFDKKVVISVRASEYEHKKLARIAERYHCKPSEMVRKLIDRAWEREGLTLEEAL
jgi:hypothetical protein